MASSKKKSKIGGVIVGPIFVFLGLSALWKNETRFDYHKAAAKTTPAASLATMENGGNYSYTGRMNEELTLPGKYIKTFTGYLVVSRSAEIYCWDRDEDSEGDVTWRREWMNSVQSNSRNSGIRQTLDSGRILPSSYEVEDLQITSRRIEFVDSYVSVSPEPLPRTEEGDALSLAGDYLMLRKGRSDNLGDERISYRAIPVPYLATWFGKFDSGRGVADVSQEEEGMINSIIQNTGVLHHLVAGERKEALGTMLFHIKRLKWIIRAIGTAVIVFGLLFLFSSFLRFLYPIPLLGRIAEAGSFLLALAIGIPLATTTILLGFVAGNPILLIPILIVILAAIWMLVRFSKRQRKAGETIKQQLDEVHGHTLESDEMKELKYREMAGMLASSENEMGTEQSATLSRFAAKSGLDAEKQETLLQEVQSGAGTDQSAEVHLQNLIRLAVADDKLTPQEVKSIREAATLAGYNREQFRKLISEMSGAAGELKAS
ncbi:MAG: TMEM43 family protein [Verrucomicrobiota bacterium]